MNPDAGLTFACPYRILFGPLYNSSSLGRWLGHANLRTFNSTRAVTMSERHQSRPLMSDSYYDYEGASFADILAALPAGWQPDLVIWSNLSLYGLPPGIEDCPWPTLAIIHDWHLNLQALLDYVQAFDFVVADRAFVQILGKMGFDRCAYWSCYAHDPTQHYLLPATDRPYDVSFLGNMSYHFHGGRNRWLQRLSRLDADRRVLISDRLYGQDYLRALNQSKIVFNYSIRGEMNMRAYEAAACGALVLCESDNLEIRDFLTDGESCVLYDEADFEEKIAYYLAHDDERRRIAANGARAIARYDCEWQFARLIELVPAVQAAFKTSARQRFRAAPAIWKRLLNEQQFAHSRTPKSAPPAAAELMTGGRDLAAAEQAQLSALVGALGLRRYWDAARLLQPSPLPPGHPVHQAVALLEAGVRALPGHLWHAYNLACAYSLLQQPERALSLWSQLIPRLQHLQPQDIDFATLSWMPSQSHPAAHPRSYLWDTTAGAALPAALGKALAGQGSDDLARLMLHQAFELVGYCLMRLGRAEPAIQAFSQAEALVPGSYFTYAPLLQLLQQTGRQPERLACLLQATEQMGLAEFLHRDLISALRAQGAQGAQGRLPALKTALENYRFLLTRVEGGGPTATDTPQAWIPQIMLWQVEGSEQ
ncbi:MAG: glycosyltransferase [Candidatus Sericytochromatia bacterium]